METKTANTEVQLGFAFFTEHRSARQEVKSQALAKALRAARTALLETSLSEVDAQLPFLLEFCEAALTRVLDVVPIRPQVPFSDEEYRSLRGIGQAQWLLAERQSKDNVPASTHRIRKP